jgi:hypothetical protein
MELSRGIAKMIITALVILTIVMIAFIFSHIGQAGNTEEKYIWYNDWAVWSAIISVMIAVYIDRYLSKKTVEETYRDV